MTLFPAAPWRCARVSGWKSPKRSAMPSAPDRASLENKMKTRNLLLYCTALLLSVLSLSARAEDIDLFTGTKADQTVPPNLLLIVGNAAHSSSNAGMNNCVIDGTTSTLSGTALGVEQCA